MSQVTIYLPDPLERRVKQEAKAAGTSLSAFIASALRRSLKMGSRAGELEALYGSWKGKFPSIDDAPPDEPDSARAI